MNKLLLITLILIIGCKDKTLHYKTLVTNLEPKYQPYNYSLIDKEKYYIFGEKSLSDNKTKLNTIIKVANKHNPLSWTVLTMDVEGACMNVSQTNENIYLTTRKTYVDTKNMERTLCYKLYKVSKIDGHVDQIFKWKNDIAITGVDFVSDSIGYVAIENNDYSNIALLSTKDGGRSWDELKIEYPIRKLINKPNNIYLHCRVLGNKERVLTINKKLMKVVDSVFFNFDIDDINIDNNSNIYILKRTEGTKKYQQSLYKYIKSSLYKYIKSTNKLELIKVFPENIHFIHHAIYIYDKYVSIIGVKYSIEYFSYYSTDNGSNWNNVEFGDVLYVSAISYFDDKEIFAYGGSNLVIVGMGATNLTK